jgi:hypothetical protein
MSKQFENAIELGFVLAIVGGVIGGTEGAIGLFIIGLLIGIFWKD